jgi:hypothetical protein
MNCKVLLEQVIMVGDDCLLALNASLTGKVFSLKVTMAPADRPTAFSQLKEPNDLM